MAKASTPETVPTSRHHHNLWGFLRHPVTYGGAVVAATDFGGMKLVSSLHHADPVRHEVLAGDVALMAPLTFLIGHVVRLGMELSHAKPETIRRWMPASAVALGAAATKATEHYVLHTDPMPGGVPGINLGEMAVLAADGAVGAGAAQFGMHHSAKSQPMPIPNQRQPEQAPRPTHV